MNQKRTIIYMLVIAVLLSACSAAASTPAATTAPVTMPTVAPTTAPSAAQPQSALAATALDPCQLVTSQEASSLAGATFGAGTESSTPEGLKSCHYGTQGTNIFTVEVFQAPDVATAQKYKDQFLADLQGSLSQLSSEGLNTTQLPNLADGAVFASASVSGQGITMNGSALGVLKGTIFFGYSDIVLTGGPAPTSDALQAEAKTVLGRLP